MKKGEVVEKLASCEMKADEMAEVVLSDLKLLPAVIDGVGSDNKRVKNATAKILRIVSEKHPERLYPHFSLFVDHLEGGDTILKWNAIMVIANLAAVDKKNLVDRQMKKYYECLGDEKMVTAANAIDNMGKIACAKPKLRNDITKHLISVENIQRNPECSNIHLGKVILAFERYYDDVKPNEQKKMLALAERLLGNRRPATKKKAERFLQKHK